MTYVSKICVAVKLQSATLRPHQAQDTDLVRDLYLQSNDLADIVRFSNWIVCSRCLSSQAAFIDVDDCSATPLFGRTAIFQGIIRSSRRYEQITS